MTPYKSAALRYMTHGWQGPLPVGNKPQQKTHPPTGYTGNDGTWPTEEQIVEWTRTRPDVNIALRLPPNIIGLDVDDYDNKPGADTMTATTEAHGKLPRTWISTSRAGLSGIRWFQHSQRTVLPGKLVHPDDPNISGVEIIQHTHRYAVVPPSVHPEGEQYRWITPNGEPVENGTIPKPSNFPEIPQAWLDHILQDCSCWAPFKWDRYQTTPNDPVKTAYSKWRARMTETYGRHDAALGGIMALTAFKERGWPGADHWIEQLQTDFHNALGDTRTPKQAELEWERMVDGARKKAVTTTIPIWQPQQTGSQSSPNTFDARVEAELDQLRVRDTARRRWQKETSPPQPIPAILTLKERLTRPHPPIEWRIEGWQPADTRVLLAAQYKAGKTTLTGNLARCLVDNQPWLGVAPVTPIVSGHVTILDFEMSERQIDGWLADQQIVNDHKITVIPLRGRAGTFDILDETTRKEWATRLTGTAYIILDCLRPILDALALDEHREAGRFLTAFDTLCDQAGIRDGLVVHHMGHTGERSRGDSRLRDWPDVEWRLVRKTDEPDSVRYVSAFGRDVEYPEGEISYDPNTRHLKYLGGSRELSSVKEVLDDVLDVLKESNDPLSQRAIIALLKDRTEHSRAAIKKAISLGVAEYLIHARSGAHNSNLHHHIDQCASDPQCATAHGAVVRSAPHPFRGGALAHTEIQQILEEQLGAQEINPEDLPDAY